MGALAMNVINGIVFTNSGKDKRLRPHVGVNAYLSSASITTIAGNVLFLEGSKGAFVTMADFSGRLEFSDIVPTEGRFLAPFQC